MIWTHVAVRRVSHMRPGINTGCIVIGSHTSTKLPTESPKNSGGATPTIVSTASAAFGAFGFSGSKPLVPPPAIPPFSRIVRPAHRAIPRTPAATGKDVPSRYLDDETGKNRAALV